MPNDNTATLENVRLIFRNFAGRPGPYNDEGDRNFAVLLDEKTAKVMDRDGWNVKALKSREEGDPDQPYLPVKVSYKGRPPRIVIIASGRRTILDEETIDVLDWADIVTVDLIIRPYEWAVGGKSGIKAYLQTMFVTINEDALERKYANMDDDQSPNG